MSAQDSPVWGREAGRFSTFTANAGLIGTPDGGCVPVSGQNFGGGEAEGPPDCGLPAADGPCERPPRKATAKATAPTTTRKATAPATTRPRLVAFTAERILLASGGEERADANGKLRRYNDPTRSSHLLEDTYAVLYRWVG